MPFTNLRAEQAKQLHALIGASLQAVTDSRTDVIAELQDALEIAALLVADLDGGDLDYLLAHLDLSTGHVSDDDRLKLETLKSNGDTKDSSLPRIIDSHYGWIIPLGYFRIDDEDAEENMRRLRDAMPSVADCAQYALDRGGELLVFDADATTVADLPVYDWRARSYDAAPDARQRLGDWLLTNLGVERQQADHITVSAIIAALGGSSVPDALKEILVNLPARSSAAGREGQTDG